LKCFPVVLIDISVYFNILVVLLSITKVVTGHAVP